MGTAFGCFDQILTGWTLILPNDQTHHTYIQTLMALLFPMFDEEKNPSLYRARSIIS
jgi:hypothetical protein